ncbi:hypothetical protein BTR22_01040 [Alkalihalophilus pseudofirmus]|uniref:excisionase family DNA-binding protein n=1 Tax=Alkalihalophilus pseudofirmus TaxID=79885 RepID=UPI00095110AF|nr:excisionase family DNA-binding protein [Alkalihalophilus pseudofirmus]OLS39486.1 hypothetical protein BTR22_01040 [Alkalihalophilus pseudofirmus]WEG15943.1 excisionase family DNA-binding protein [Alkalihalophilus pseudofirmus]
MYVSIEDLAEYLGVSSLYIKEQIQKGNIRAVFDGNSYLINKAQFSKHKEQIDLKKKQLAEELAEPIPEDWDAKDED